jgi:O-antigen/teichoic acid export membrane protein
VLKNDPALVRILKNSGWLLSAKGMSLPMQVVQSVLVARLLGVSGFGTFGVIVAYVEMARRLTSFRMNDVVVKFVTDAIVARDKPRAAATMKAALGAEVCTSLVSFLLVWVTVPFVAKAFLGNEAANAFIAIYGASILIDCMLEPATGLLQVFNRFRVQAIADVLGKVVSLVAVAIVFLGHGGMLAVIIAYLIGNSLSTGLVLVFAAREAAEQLGRGWWRTPIAVLRGRGRELTGFALSTNLGGTLSLIVKDSELLWLGYFTTPAAAGLYKLAKSWITMVVIPAAPLVKSFYPAIARTIAGRELTATKRLLRKGTALAALWIVPVGACFLAVSPWMVPRLYGPDYRPAITVFAILLLGMGISDIVFWVRPLLLSLGRADFALWITALHTVLKVVLVVSLVPAGGAIAMASITAGLFILGTLIGATFALYRLRVLGKQFPAPPPDPASSSASGSDRTVDLAVGHTATAEP